MLYGSGIKKVILESEGNSKSVKVAYIIIIWRTVSELKQLKHKVALSCLISISVIKVRLYNFCSIYAGNGTWILVRL